MKNQFVPYELAVKLKELGFDEECFGSWTDDGLFCHGYSRYNMLKHCVSPLWQQAFLFIYKISNGKINITIEGNDNYKTLSEKLERSIKNIRNL